MRSRRTLPGHCLLVHTYQELRGLARAFALGAYELLGIIGDPGIGKSETVKRAMREVRGPLGWGLVKGKHTPLDLYERMYRYRSMPIVLDDLDDLLQRKENVMLLKCLCDTVPVKRVEWGSWHWAFQSGQLPKSFEAISRVCLLANDWASLDRNIAAVHDRGLTVVFRPSALELHRELAGGGWFDDAEVFDFIGRHLFLVVQPSFRFYLTAREHKKAGLDWQGLTLRTLESGVDPKQILVARLLADPRYDALAAPEAARIEAFRDHPDGGSKATYFRHKAELLARRGTLAPADVEAIKLQPHRPDLHCLALWDRRQQIEQEGAQPFPLPWAGEGDEAGAQTETDPLPRLRRALARAIAREHYELAAQLRDDIQQIERDRKEEAS